MRTCLFLCAIGFSASVATAQTISSFYETVSREVLPANDGWAAFGAGTTGGAAAAPDRVFVVTNRAQLIASLAGTAPKIIFVSGTINLNVDDCRALESHLNGLGVSWVRKVEQMEFGLIGTVADPDGNYVQIIQWGASPEAQ